LLVLVLLLSTVVIVSTAPEGVEARAGIFQTEGGWSVEVVDGEGIVGIQSSLAIDDFGYAHIAYRNYDDSTLRYATNADGFWNITTVDTEVSVDEDSEISLALDSENNVHICYMSYYNSEDENLIYATNAGGSWTTTLVDAHYQAGYYNDIFVDGSDHVHIAYSVQNAASDTDLKYANNTSGTWVNETADSGVEVGMHPSIVVDDYGVIHIVYFNQDAVSLMWGHKHSSVWFRSPLDDSGDCGYFTSMAISDGSELHVSYFDEGADDLKYLHYDGVQWDLSPTIVDSVGDVGRHSSICVGSDDDPHIAYYDGTNYALKVASLLDGGWNVTTVDDAGGSSVGEYCSIAISRSGKLGISNYYGGSDDLLYTSQNAWIIDKLAGGIDNRCFGNTDIVLDDDNNAYISYTANSGYELWFATNVWGSWTYMMIDNTTGGFGGRTSIALGPDNHVHIAYYASDSGEIRYATHVGMYSWTWEKVADTRPNWGTNDLSLKVDSDGKAHIAYSFFEDSGFTSSLRYANNIGGTWVNETIDDSVADTGRYPSMAIGDTGVIYISYVDQTNKNLRWSSNAIGSWVSGNVDISGNISGQTSIAVEDANHLYVSYQDIINHDLKFAYYNGGAWLTYTVDTPGWVGDDSSIGVDHEGKVHISYLDTDNSDLKYATGNGSTWSITSLDHSGIVGEDTSLAVGTDGKVHIAYEDGTNSQIGYATNSPWRFDTFETYGEPLVGEGYVSLDRDARGAYHICFYDEPDEALRYATNTTMGWASHLVDFDFGSGMYCSIAADSNGKAHISYYDQTNGDLKYATNVAGLAFAVTVVDAPGNVGEYTSIAVDHQGHAHISYFDETNSQLKYATNAGGTWANETVDNSGYSGLHTSIAIDTEGIVHISYYTGTVGLRYANNSGGSWNAITVDGGNVGVYNSLALDSRGKAHISYYDSVNQDLMYASVLGATVTNEVVDGSADNTGARSSIGVDTAGKVHISYYDQTNGDLRYAAQAGDFWWTSTVDVAGDVGKPNSLHVDDWGVVFICYTDVTDSKVKIAMQRAEPSAPRGLTLIADEDDVEVSWSQPWNNNWYPVEGYIVVHTHPDGEVELIYGGTATSRLDNSLGEGVHRYKVAAYNLMGTGPFCAEEEVTVALTVLTVPLAPNGLTAEGGNGNVSLSWSAPSNDGGSPITGYKVYRGTASGGATVLTTLGTVLNYLDLNVTNGQPYYYQVSAVNAIGEGPRSSEVSDTPLGLPSEPLNLTAVLNGTEVILTWEAPADDGGSPVTGYKVYSGNTSDDLALQDTIGNLLTYTFVLPDLNETWYFHVTAVNSVGEGPESNEAASDPDLPTSPSLTAEAEWDGVVLTWTAPTSNGSSPISSYQVFRGNNSGTLTMIAELGNVLIYEDGAVVAGSTYYYKVRAVNGQGEGPFSNEVSVTVGAVPTAPLNMEATAGNGTVTLTWEAPEDDGGWTITGYKVYRGTSEGSLSLLATLGNVTTYLDSSVTNGQTYYYKVSAVNEFGEGPATEIDDAKPMATGGGGGDGDDDDGDGGDSTMLFVIIAVVGIAAVAGAAIFLMRRKK
jgi:fibronectin type 3 domain-containing protein